MGDEFPDYGRRKTIQLIGVGTLGLATGSLWGCVSAPSRRPSAADVTGDGPRLLSIGGRDFGPMDRVSAKLKQTGFSGDNPDHSHAILWDKQGYLKSKGQLPAISERHSVVIVGGGLGGIISAYMLRDHKPIILERAERLGGNAKGESWQGIDYSIGAAYFMAQEADSDLYKLFSAAGIHGLCRTKSDGDPVIFKNRILKDFWKGESDPAAAAQFKKVNDLFDDICHERNGWTMPNIPPQTAKDRTALDALDKMNFKEFLLKEFPGGIHPHIETLLEHYCWSTLGALMSALSAATAVPTYASEFADVYVPRGGNGAVAEKFLSEFVASTSVQNVRPSSLVIDVKVEADGVSVLYEAQDGQLKRILAKAVIMACPKFVVKKVIDDLEPSRQKAIDRLKYTSYLVANVLLKTRSTHEDDYDSYLIGDGLLPSPDPKASSGAQKVTDVVNATYAQKNTDQSVLTLYRALPFDGSRGEIFSPESYAQYQTEFREQLVREILPPLGYKEQDIHEIRITRWGHPIPVAGKGVYLNRTFDELVKPFKQRVFFVEQDNWAAPAIETCALEAIKWTPEVRKMI